MHTLLLFFPPPTYLYRCTPHLSRASFSPLSLSLSCKCLVLSSSSLLGSYFFKVLELLPLKQEEDLLSSSPSLLINFSILSILSLLSLLLSLLSSGKHTLSSDSSPVPLHIHISTRNICRISVDIDLEEHEKERRKSEKRTSEE